MLVREIIRLLGAMKLARARGWRQAPVQFYSSVIRGESRCSVVVSSLGERWSVVALENPRDAASVEGVLSLHAHQVIGEWQSLDAALEAGSRFLWRWQTTNAELELCLCDTIRNVKLADVVGEVAQ